MERSAGLVLEKEGEYLLLHYAAGHWDFPKGHIEEGETPEQAALRELEEETGIAEAEILPGFSDNIQYFYKKEEKTIYKEVVFFLATTKTAKVVLSHEHKGFAWLAFEGAVEKLTFDNAKVVLKKAHGWLNEKS